MTNFPAAALEAGVFSITLFCVFTILTNVWGRLTR